MTEERSADPACYDLAEHFMPKGASSEMMGRLAQHIQEAVEEWMDCYDEANPRMQTSFPPGSCAHCGQFHSSAVCPP